MFSEKYSAVSRTNSRRRQVSADYVFPKYILTAQVAWSLIYFSRQSSSSKYWLWPLYVQLVLQCPSKFMDPAGSHLSELRLTYQQRSKVPGSWHGNITFVSNSGPKSYAKAPRLLKAELGSRKSSDQNWFSSQLCCRTSRTLSSSNLMKHRWSEVFFEGFKAFLSDW